MQPQKHGRSWRTSSTLEHHSPGGAPATVTCSYIEAGRWILGWGNLVHDTTTIPGPCSEKSASPREGRGHCAAGVPPWVHMGRVGFDLFPPGRSRVSHPTCEVPFTPRRSGEYRKGMIPARPLYQGGCGSVWDPEPSKERVGDWGGLETVWSLLCVAETRATRLNGELGYSTRRQCWATSAQGRCHPEEALYLPTFSHLFYCQSTSLSLSLSLSLTS